MPILTSVPNTAILVDSTSHLRIYMEKKIDPSGSVSSPFIFQPCFCILLLTRLAIRRLRMYLTHSATAIIPAACQNEIAELIIMRKPKSRMILIIARILRMIGTTLLLPVKWFDEYSCLCVMKSKMMRTI